MDGSIGQLGLRSITANSCCAQLAKVLGSKVSFPGNSGYETTQASYFSLQEAALSPACIVIPSSSHDVAEAVTIISGIPSCHFAIKGQSHTPAAGAANINTGVTIDMTPLKTVSVNDDHTVASVGGGASWLDVYTYLDTLGLSVAGGRNGQIVLASGKLTNINETSSPDLFRSLKGGGNNFGVVTRFDFAAFPQGQILAGNIAQDISYREEVFKAFADIADAPNYDPYASLVMGATFNATSKVWGVATTAIYTKPVTNPPVYAELLSIPTTTSTLHLTNLRTYGVSAKLLDEMFDSLNETLYDFNIEGGIFWSIAFEPLPTAITKWGALKGGNSLGTSPKDGNAFVVLVAALWSNATLNDLVEKKAAQVTDNLAAVARSMGLLHEFQYLNYADPSQDPIRSYGPENVRELRKTSRKFDPRGVFQRQVPGGFKLGLQY
ncbi:FAD-dependent monooxygenase [Hyphodiscus hymeniophilus]|uniref:FAD-dependent monooxygenase n=1 Tax=Hyphodiscus hymeniophilus TaxID=353542 RepID=A0A9P6VIH4_9HELO|nr:FAD-dependent monooxygenase [Hyphodiscus hymeniophilus]